MVGRWDQWSARVGNHRDLDLTRTTINDSASSTESYVAMHCASCHGIDGNQNVSRRVPVLAGQNREYLAWSLSAYRDMTRHSGVMMPVAYHLSDSQIDDLADYFAGQTRAATYKKEESLSDTNSQDSELIQLGSRLANQGDASEKIPSCVDCHGPAKWLQSNAYPRLAGQPAWYIVRQLELFSK